MCNQLSYGHPLGEESRPELNAVEKLQAAIEADKPLVQVEAAQPKPDAQLAPQIVRAPQPEEPKPQSDAKPEASKPQADAKPQESKPQAVAQTKAEQPAFQTPAPQQEGGSAAKPQANLETVIYTVSVSRRQKVNTSVRFNVQFNLSLRFRNPEVQNHPWHQLNNQLNNRLQLNQSLLFDPNPQMDRHPLLSPLPNHNPQKNQKFKPLLSHPFFHHRNRPQFSNNNSHPTRPSSQTQRNSNSNHKLYLRN